MHLDAPYGKGTGDEEVLALHCDPMSAASDPSYPYKRGPHLHISGNKRDISKAHIALCLTNLDETCSGPDAISVAFSAIITMISKELLPRLA